MILPNLTLNWPPCGTCVRSK